MPAKLVRRALYPSTEPFATHKLAVSPLHTIHYEECGTAGAKPVIALHGGPGGGISPEMRRFFKPDAWHVFLADQRGCGQSLPHASLEDNTTQALIADIEAIRERAGIDKWVVFGGSWGSTLALAYAITHPERVSGLILRGIFLVTKHEINWFYQNGAGNLFPESFERYLAAIPEAERGDMLTAYYSRLTSPDLDTRISAARAWAQWEGDCLSIAGPPARPTRFGDDHFVEAFARIEAHYFVNDGFFPKDDWIVDNAARLAGIPGHIAHGRYDVITPISSAYRLAKAWPGATLDIIPDAGHSSMEPGIVDSLIRATDRFALL